MKKINLTVIFTFFVMALVRAQDSVVVDKQEAVSWLQKNWIWVAGAVILIILIAALSGGKKRSKTITTTTLSDTNGNVKKVTTEETEI